jgi:hypothetical protein
MTNMTVPIRKMSMIPTVSAIRDLLAEAVRSSDRTSSTITAPTRSSPKICSVADAMKVPSTAMMIRNRLVPRIRRIMMKEPHRTQLCPLGPRRPVPAER